MADSVRHFPSIGLAVRFPLPALAGRPAAVSPSPTDRPLAQASHFSAGDSLRAIHQTPGIYRVSLKQMQSQPCFFTKSVRIGRAELFFFFWNPHREIYNLGMVSGPVL